MAPKRKEDSSDGSASKKRKAITKELKLDIVKRSDKGETETNIGRSLGLSRSTVATIIKDKDTVSLTPRGSPVFFPCQALSALLGSPNQKSAGVFQHFYPLLFCPSGSSEA
ncbi:hypothetical protein MHYP_G00148980 [Metynnis hypsauchen]